MLRECVSRRRLLKLMGLGVAGATLAACQPQVVEKVVKETVEVEKEVTRIVEAEPAQTEPVTVKVTSAYADMPGWQECFDGFVAAQDRIKVESFTTSREKLTVAMATRTLPDLTRVDALNVVDFFAGGGFRSVQPFVDADGYQFDWAYDVVRPWLDYPPNSGDLYLMPFQGGSQIVYYNKDHFDEAGVDYPSKDWTWIDYLEIAQKLTKFDDRGKALRYGSFAFPNMWWDSWFITLVQAGGVPFRSDAWQLGGFTDPEFLGPADTALPGYSVEAMRQAMQFLHDLVYEYEACSRPGYELPEGAGFLSGNVSMTYSHNAYPAWIAQSETVNNWGVVRPPKAATDEGRHATQSYVCGWVMAYS